jgi:hypothetical protein
LSYRLRAVLGRGGLRFPAAALETTGHAELNAFEDSGRVFLGEDPPVPGVPRW